MRTFREVNQGFLLLFADCEFQRVNPVGMMPHGTLLQLKTTGMQSKLTEQQRRVISMRKAALVAQPSYGCVVKLSIHHSQEAAHFGHGRLVLNQEITLQPIL